MAIRLADASLLLVFCRSLFLSTSYRFRVVSASICCKIPGSKNHWKTGKHECSKFCEKFIEFRDVSSVSDSWNSACVSYDLRIHEEIVRWMKSRRGLFECNRLIRKPVLLFMLKTDFWLFFALSTSLLFRLEFRWLNVYYALSEMTETELDARF
jgi:hypothetical protein